MSSDIVPTSKQLMDAFDRLSEREQAIIEKQADDLAEKINARRGPKVSRMGRTSALELLSAIGRFIVINKLPVDGGNGDKP